MVRFVFLYPVILILGIIAIWSLRRRNRPALRWPFRVAQACLGVIVLPLLTSILLGRDAWNALFFNETVSGLGLLWVFVGVPIALVLALVMTVVGLVQQRR